MDAAQALANLTEISAQIETAVVFDGEGSVVASTVDDDERSRRLARAAHELLSAAERKRRGDESLAQLEVAFPTGSVFLVRHDDRAVAATTAPEPTVGLVFYDLKSCLREASAPEEKKAAKARTRTPSTTRKRTSASTTPKKKKKDDAES